MHLAARARVLQARKAVEELSHLMILISNFFNINNSRKC